MEIFGVGRGAITNWLNAWETRRFAGLYDQKGNRRKPDFTASQKAQIVQWAKACPKNLKKVVARVKETFGISVCKRTIQRVLKSFKFSWRRVRHKPQGEPEAGEYEHKKEE